MKTLNVVFATIAVIGSIASSARAADLFLRPAGAEGGSSMTLGEGQTSAIEIVVRLEEDEELGFANVFLEIDHDEPLEALDFIPGLDVPPAVYTSHEQVLRNRYGEFPYSPGDGISVSDYALILSTGGLVGPGTFVLERIEVFGSAAGVVRVAFEFDGGRPPGLFDSDSNQYAVATNEFPRGLSRIVYVGIGDDREGEAGPLTITVEQASPPEDDGPPPPGDDNDNDNDDGISNDNGSDDPPDQDPTDNDNITDDDNDNDNIAPPGDDEPDPDDPPPDDGGANDDGTPIDPAGEDNANVSDDAPDNANSGDADPGNTNDPPIDQPDDQPGEQDVPGDNDNTGQSTPPPATRLCGFGILPALVSMLAALGFARRRSIRPIG